MPFCSRCGKEVLQTDLFCTNCGFNIKQPVQAGAPQTQAPVQPVSGLSRSAVVRLTGDGLFGIQVRSNMTLVLASALSVPLLAVVYLLIQHGALAVYFTVWIAVAGLVYDELRWRGVRKIGGATSESPPAGVESWLIPWSSIRMADWNGRTLWVSSSDPNRKASITFDQKDGPSVEQALTSRGVRFSWRPPRLPGFLTRYWTLVAVFFIASQVILFAAATFPFFPGEEQMYSTVLSNTRSQFSNLGFLDELRLIYFNNVQVALGGAVPFLGVLSYGIASYNTGRLVQEIAIGAQTSPLLILVSLYILPHAWVEELCYPVAMVAGLLGVTKWRSVSPGEFTLRRNWGSTKLALGLAGAAMGLLLAGFLEVMVRYLSFFAVLLWAPLAVAYYLVAMRRRKRKAADMMGSP